MRKTLAVLVLCLVVLSGCDEDFDGDFDGNFDCDFLDELFSEGSSQERIQLPPVQRDRLASTELPVELRQRNWTPGGSCGHASMMTMFENQPGGAQGDALAKMWGSHYSGGESLQGLINKCKRHNVPIWTSTNYDRTLLEHCARTGRMAVVEDARRHIRTFAGMDDNYVYIIDNNPHNNTRTPLLPYPREQWFRQNWRGWALAAQYEPAPPVTR